LQRGETQINFIASSEAEWFNTKFDPVNHVYPVKIKGHMNFQEQTITIQQVSQRHDVPKPTLRFWEKEFEGILVPLRTSGGQRRYAPEHVSVIEEIKMLKKAGLSLMEIKGKMGKERMSEAGSLKSRDGQTEGIDLLADRVAEVVKMEVLRFFQRSQG